MEQFKIILLLCISIFFILMGIDLLIAAYRLTNPFNFILTFFAANLMILISGTLCVGFALRLKNSFGKTETKQNQSKP